MTNWAFAGEGGFKRSSWSLPAIRLLRVANRHGMPEAVRRELEEPHPSVALDEIWCRMIAEMASGDIEGMTMATRAELNEAALSGANPADCGLCGDTGVSTVEVHRADYPSAFIRARRCVCRGPGLAQVRPGQPLKSPQNKGFRKLSGVSEAVTGDGSKPVRTGSQKPGFWS